MRKINKKNMAKLLASVERISTTLAKATLEAKNQIEQGEGAYGLINGINELTERLFREEIKKNKSAQSKFELLYFTFDEAKTRIAEIAEFEAAIREEKET